MSDNMESTNAIPAVKKVKKKQVKDEMDRIKQAEKKKRRLEKALATSLAIRCELEKKKQMKKEEQQRLDEEGAAIAEKVALHVLLGEDTDNSYKAMLHTNEVFNQLECMGRANCSREGFGWACNGPKGVCDSNDWRNNKWYHSYARNVHGSYLGEGDNGISAGLSAAQALASLHIAEDARVDSVMFTNM